MLKGFKPEKHLVRDSGKNSLQRFPTRVDDLYESDDDYERLVAASRDELADQQERLYAENQHSLLLILQGMDTSGKDGLIKHVFTGINPQGCHVASFKQPSHAELNHDFLWRTNRELPPRGYIGIFNRSYYEDVIVVRVHPELLENGKVPPKLRRTPRLWKERYEDIVNHERYLSRQGTKIIKVFLHLSRKEQRERLIARIDEQEKHWKFDTGDYKERQHWPAYQKAYSDCLNATSSSEAPWYVIPADDKQNARLMVSHILVRALEDMNLKFPKVPGSKEKELRKIRKALSRE